MDEDDVNTSLRSRIKALEIGDSESVAKRFDLDTATRQIVTQTTDRLLNSLESTVGRLKVQTGHDYVIERGQFSTRTRDIVVAAVITRVA